MAVFSCWRVTVLLRDWKDLPRNPRSTRKGSRMFRKTPHVNPLEMRRQLLVAKSELSRAQLPQELQTMAEGVRGLAHRAKSISSLASAAAWLVAGVSAFRRSKAMPGGVKSS